MRLPNTIRQLLTHRDDAMVLQGVELLLSLHPEQPAVIDHLLEGCGPKADGSLLIGPHLTGVGDVYQEWVALRLLAATGRLDAVQRLTLGDALQVSDVFFLAPLPALQTIRLREVHAMEGLKDAVSRLPKTLKRLDLQQTPTLNADEIAALLPLTSADCVLQIDETSLWLDGDRLRALMSTHPNIVIAPYLLPAELEGSGRADTVYTLNLNPHDPEHGDFVLREEEEDNHGSSSVRWRGRYHLDRERRIVQLHRDTREEYLRHRCARRPCQGQARLSFAGGVACEAPDCQRLPADWVVTHDPTDTLEMTVNWKVDTFSLDHPDFYVAAYRW